MNVFVILIIYDLGVVVQVVDRVVVMYVGKMVEIGMRKDIFYQLQYFYMKGLLNFVLWLDMEGVELILIDGMLLDLFLFLSGCLFVVCCLNRMIVCDRVYLGQIIRFDMYIVNCWLQD